MPGWKPELGVMEFLRENAGSPPSAKGSCRFTLPLRERREGGGMRGKERESERERKMRESETITEQERGNGRDQCWRKKGERFSA